MKRLKAILVDVDVVNYKGKSIIRLLLKRKKMFRLYDKDFKPYFYLETDREIKPGFYNGIEILGVEEVKKKIGQREVKLKKIICSDPKEVPIMAQMLNEYGRIYEKDIKFNKRYLIDKDIRPMNTVEIEYEGKFVKSIKDVGDILSADRLNSIGFDIEVYNPHGIPDESEDPIIIISYSDEKESGAITWKASNIKDAILVKDEKELIEKFVQILREKDIDLIAGYNSSVFDIPYLKARAKELGMRLEFGRDGSEPKVKRIGMTTHIKINGRVHTDIYYIVRILAAAQAIKLERHTLEEVYKELIGGEEWKVDTLSISQMWDNDKGRDELIKYAIKDSSAAYEIFKKIYPLEVELA
ncbi:MAG: hypothetical protein NZ903_03220, partial [Candidatus Micrarchaeota archaeon]|nr:hypothetical protein [Candidatus Micrarchaeota archaeon]